MTSRIKHHSPHYASGEGAFGLSYHLEMVKDAERVGQIYQALAETLQPDSVHYELGSGTGIFLIAAAKLAKKVYGIELDPQLYQLAKANIAQQTAAIRDKIVLLQGDASTLAFPEKAATVLVEMMSTWLMYEPQVRMMNLVREQLLAPGGKLIPSGVVNLVELGNYSYTTGGITIPGVIPQFSGVVAPRIMTGSVEFNRYDFYQPQSDTVAHSVTLESMVSGTINCARLSSIVQLSESVTFYATDSLMPPLIVPLDHAIEVRAGDTIQFTAQYRLQQPVERARFCAVTPS